MPQATETCVRFTLLTLPDELLGWWPVVHEGEALAFFQSRVQARAWARRYQEAVGLDLEPETIRIGVEPYAPAE